MKKPHNIPENPAPAATNPAAEPAPAATPAPAEPDLAAKNAELLADLQRTRADFENFRKQVELQRDQARQLGAETTILKLLPLLDDMARAFKSQPEALAPIQKSFDKTLSELGLTRINAEHGADFNPDLHEAISMEDGDGDREVVVEELRPGYVYENNVIRAAMVRVGKAK